MSEHYDQREALHDANQARAAADAVHAAVEKVVDMQRPEPAGTPAPEPALLQIRLPLAMPSLARLLAVADQIWPGCVVGPERAGYMTLVPDPAGPRCRKCGGDGFVEGWAGPRSRKCPDCIPKTGSGLDSPATPV